MHSNFFSLRKPFFVIFILVAVNFLLVGNYSYEQVNQGSDARGYNAYATNIALRGVYSSSEAGFSTEREPGYPLFLAALYGIFGVENFAAVKGAQVLLLSFSGFFIFLAFRLFGFSRLGLLVGVLFVLLPPYAYYANFLLVETLFTFLLTGTLCLFLFIIKHDPSRLFYLLLGAVLSLLVLTRMHMLFLPLVIFSALLFLRKPLRSVLLALGVFLFFVAGWASIVYSHTGNFTVSSGRQEIHLYARSIRAEELSYAGNMRYFVSWVKRSLNGGKEDGMLLAYDSGALSLRLEKELRDGKPIRVLREESFTRLKENPGHFLFGNFVEWGKLMFIEHLSEPFSPILTRYFRAGFYFVLYACFFAGILGFLLSRNRELLPLFLATSAFILYHWGIMVFFDVVPRLNTPYLGLYLALGIVGITSFYQKIKNNNHAANT
jgi:4-amino-4-deoxy-L-arabinose transferase-like glycosyltransferase